MYHFHYYLLAKATQSGLALCFHNQKVEFVSNYIKFEPQHDKINKMTRAPSKDLDQPASAQSDQSLL